MEPENLVLRPNCLLTKAPVVFVPGRRSIFHYAPMGSDLQVYLAAHGYQVYSVPLPFRDFAHRTLALTQWLNQMKSKSMHFVMSQKTYLEFNNKIVFHPQSTFTVIGENFVPTPTPALKIPAAFYLHQFYCRIIGSNCEPYAQTMTSKNQLDYDRFLDHCVQLAEDEITGD